jgi:hypothetical protein
MWRGTGRWACDEAQDRRWPDPRPSYAGRGAGTGPLLTESDQFSSALSTFTVTPEIGLPPADRDTLAGGRRRGGFFERLFAPRVLPRIYADEHERLDRYACTAP